MDRRKPGRVVKCKDGRVGRTYNDEQPINGKIRVHLFPPSVRAGLGGTTRDIDRTLTQAKQEITKVDYRGKEPEKRLCDPNDLTTIGYAD